MKETFDAKLLKVRLERPRPAYRLVVVGTEGVRQPLVSATLDHFTQRIRCEYHVDLVVRDQRDPAVSWAESRMLHCVGYEVVPVRRHYGRGAEARWAMQVTWAADGVLIFGKLDRWWRLKRYSANAGVPVKVVEVERGSEEETVRGENPEPVAPRTSTPHSPDDWRQWLPPD